MGTLSTLQRECFSNFLDDYPLVIRSLSQQEFDPADVCERAMELADLMEVGDVPAEEEFDALTRAIFKAAVEKNDWLYPYEGQSQAARNRLPEMRSAMRENAKFLADYDIEIDYLPE